MALPFSFDLLLRLFGGATEQAKKLAVWAYRIDEFDKKLTSLIDKQDEFNSEVTKDILDVRIKLAKLEEQIANVMSEAASASETAATRAVFPMASELGFLKAEIAALKDHFAPIEGRVQLGRTSVTVPAPTRLKLPSRSSGS